MSRQIQAGDVFFTKKARTTPKKIEFLEYTYKGYLIGVCLGITQNEMPTPKQVTGLLANIGLCGFDDVERHLGKEQMDKLLKAMELELNPEPPPEKSNLVVLP